MTITDLPAFIVHRTEETPGGAILDYRSEMIRINEDGSHVWAIESLWMGKSRISRTIVCWLIEDGKPRRIEEKMTPPFTDCPLELIKAQHRIDNQAWRDLVWEWHEEMLAQDLMNKPKGEDHE